MFATRCFTKENGKLGKKTLDKIIELSKTNIVLISSHVIELIEPYLTNKYIVKNKTIEELPIKQDLKSFFTNA
jgi:ABC-2 type transport system ATP-binding protein